MIVRKVSVKSIFANPDQPRKIFDPKGLEELAESIRQVGQLQPIKVRPAGRRRYMIVVGERRWRAVQILGSPVIDAIVEQMTDEELQVAAIVENLQRQDLSPLEEAHAFQAVLDQGISVEELAEKLGLKQPWRITERTSLLSLSDTFQDALAKGILSASQALEMSRLSPASQDKLFEAIRRGKCKSRYELFYVAQGLREAEQQVEMPGLAPAPTEEEVKAVKGLEDRIEKVCALIGKGFEGNDIVIARKVNPLNADVMADKLALLQRLLLRLESALRAQAVAGAPAPVAAERLKLAAN